MMHLEDLGRRIAAVQDADRQAMKDSEQASESFIRALRQKPHQPKLATWLAAAAMVVLVGLGAFWLGRPVAPSIELAQVPGVVIGNRIVVPEDHGIPLNFSDGSRLLLAAGTRASVVALTGEGATINVEDGRATASVVHRKSTHWALHAGPYRVAVTGTRFTLEWVPAKDRFDLVLEEGSVIVTTEKSSHAAVTMKSPEHLVIDHGEWQLSPTNQEPVLEPSSAPTPALPSVAADRPTLAAAAVSAVIGASSVATPFPESAPSLPEWQRLGKLGKFADAYSNAQKVGIPNLSQSGSAQALLTLAEVCRFAGHASESMLVLTKLRQRFAGSNESAIAAFQLGRLSSDGQLSASWFRSYLKELPNGELAREAAGRLLEALDRAGDHAGAVAAAKNYLDRYPSGPHARFARRLQTP